MNRKKPFIISIVSGKGGTGKTLITAMLADLLVSSTSAKVLVVDTDIYVRGLTTLLFKPTGQQKIADSEELVVVDLFQKHTEQETVPGKTISQFDKKKTEKPKPVFVPKQCGRSFDVFPAVHEIKEEFSLSSVMLCGIEKSVRFMEELLTVINSSRAGKDAYDYIFLDCRAGYDDLIAATHLLSDLTICVNEDDPISSVTTNILENQLIDVCKIFGKLVPEGYSKHWEPTRKLPKDYTTGEIKDYANLVRIKNKDRSFGKMRGDDIDFTVPVSLPYDADVLDAFGKKDFWNKMIASKYRGCLGGVWNAIAKNNELEHRVRIHGIDEYIQIPVANSLGKLTTMRRFAFIYSVAAMVISFLLMSQNSQLISLMKEDIILSTAIYAMGLGLLVVVLSVVNLKPLFKIFHKNKKT